MIHTFILLQSIPVTVGIYKLSQEMSSLKMKYRINTVPASCVSRETNNEIQKLKHTCKTFGTRFFIKCEIKVHIRMGFTCERSPMKKPMNMMPRFSYHLSYYGHHIWFVMYTRLQNTYHFAGKNINIENEYRKYILIGCNNPDVEYYDDAFPAETGGKLAPPARPGKA